MSKTLFITLDPTSTKHPIYLYNKYFKTPLHYLYYYTYGANNEMKYKIINARTVDNLLSFNYQLGEFAITKEEINRYLYTMICYMYCVYKDVREAINTLTDDNPAPHYVITNDSYFGKNYFKYSRALLTFHKAIITQPAALSCTTME